MEQIVASLSAFATERMRLTLHAQHCCGCILDLGMMLWQIMTGPPMIRNRMPGIGIGGQLGVKTAILMRRQLGLFGGPLFMNFQGDGAIDSPIN